VVEEDAAILFGRVFANGKLITAGQFQKKESPREWDRGDFFL